LVLIEEGGEREGKTVELTHESLIDRWVKLRQWLDENEQDAPFLAQLRNAAQQWEKNNEAEGFGCAIGQRSKHDSARAAS